MKRQAYKNAGFCIEGSNEGECLKTFYYKLKNLLDSGLPDNATLDINEHYLTVYWEQEETDEEEKAREALELVWARNHKNTRRDKYLELKAEFGDEK